MQLAILSSGTGWHVADLARAARQLGHEATLLDFRKLTAGVAVGAAPLAGFDAVLVRTMPPGSLEQVVFRMDLLGRVEAGGVAVLNSPRALEAAIDKYLTTARLDAAGLPVPPTVVCQHADAALEAFETLGRDVIVKPLFGSEGRGMVRVDDIELAWRTFRTLERTGAVLYLQKMIHHPGWDLRVFVLGGRVLAGMRRYAKDSWRTNVAQGGSAECVRVSDGEADLALRAAAVLGAEAAGVDLLQGPGGEWYVLEVNAVPGWRALAPVTGVDVAAAIVRHVAGKVGAMSNPDSIVSISAQLACLWEVTARKPGNVHRFRDFEDTTYLDFAASSAAIGLNLALAHEMTVGPIIYHCVQMTRLMVGRNTNLGIILLFAPLAKAGTHPDYRAEVEQVLAELTLNDAELAYEAIRIANPGGLGQVEDQDVHAGPTLPLREAMALAAGRDFVARQYANGFREVFEEGAPAILEGVEQTGCVEGGIIYAYLYLMSRYPDTLIARKRGRPEALESSHRAWQVLREGWPRTGAGRREIAAFDDWLRAEGHSRNPGTTADLIAASLFVLLRTWRIKPRPDVPWALAEGLL